MLITNNPNNKPIVSEYPANSRRAQAPAKPNGPAGTPRILSLDSVASTDPVSPASSANDLIRIGEAGRSPGAPERITLERALNGIENRLSLRGDRQTEETRGEIVRNAGMAPNEPGALAARFGARPQQTQPSALSLEETSSQIAQGVTGYIFNAWKAQRQSIDPEALSQFRTEVEQGLEAGFADARDILRGLRALSPQVEENLQGIFTQTLQQIQDALPGLGKPGTQSSPIVLGL